MESSQEQLCLWFSDQVHVYDVKIIEDRVMNVQLMHVPAEDMLVIITDVELNQIYSEVIDDYYGNDTLSYIKDNINKYNSQATFLNIDNTT